METKELNAIKKIDETLSTGIYEGKPLTNDIREMLTLTKGLLSKGMKLDPFISFIEAVSDYLDKQEGIAV